MLKELKGSVEYRSSKHCGQAVKEIVQNMAKKTLKVDREKFEGIVRNLLHSKPVKREDVKIKNRKNREKLIPPQK